MTDLRTLRDDEPAVFTVDGQSVTVPDDHRSLLDVLREQLGIRSAKDGCSPQGQCGCCTVLIDGVARVACVTPARRLAGRAVTTLDGIDPDHRQRWGEAFGAEGASQCGFCTPGIIMRLEALALVDVDRLRDKAAVDRALVAHLCRCTGWQTVVAAAGRFPADDEGAAVAWPGARDAGQAGRRATLEGRTSQHVGPDVALGHGGFAADTAPADALVAVPDGRGGWALGETLAEARQAAGTIQGRRTTATLTYPLEVPPGDWTRTLRTPWVEPGYLETDAAWCAPGGQPASPLANGGAFGAKVGSGVAAASRTLADEHGRPVLAVYSREDSVRLGPKRPPIAAGIRSDGTGVIRVVRTPGIAGVIGAMAPGLEIEEIDVPGPSTSAALRAAGWAEAAVLLAAVQDPQAPVRSPDGATARARVAPDGVHAWVSCGDPLDEVVLRSYCIGAAHMALGWVWSEGLAVDADGVVHDLTVRSFGILRAVDTPPIHVEIDPTPGPPVNGSDAVFAAVAAAAWIGQGCPSQWPTGRA